ncbi:hypothetical protein COCC4DRAFT_83305 [Bipolaris maydis ATCC 48331]|uniref:Carboxylic ester hydrolase n=2 Tax=Cochliobolus heterostrophus TaxID=5016 RepID=M2TNL8_COCH5|nr:uncharacterized protein COCC4DRAFT_83305 [Bipolaris maydis ATCC 48331]EMD88134.1 hypothetical protein COCHEDRAFT_1227359 [Bipolaris maydis C5]KAJ5020489.1 Alpha/Beta hydrolase protein [Bipolaris maydis]ENI02287.1 hypothetical protein COCC4DRAFT_83305 [Bipolaris maydis ATCC 48331]KAJ6207107.1 Alpha/Beta hydrolase protein [Bipolaris maydis]KAJ6268391.1 Alpha/Beta hydrolase protein [Bipolaris maydis]
MRAGSLSLFVMAALLGLLSAFHLLLFARASGVPTPQSIASDLSIITHNDLYGQASSRRAASILLSTPFTHSAARSQCAALDTTLWNPHSYAQDSAYLEYLRYAKLAGPDYLFWVDGNSTSQCTAISTRGQLGHYPCDKHLPVLCSTTAASTSLPRIAVTTNNATIVGRRDDSSPSFRFFGIKFGAFPARFTYSTYLPPTPGSSTTALNFAPICMQVSSASPDPNVYAEDCLFLNIWTPYLPNPANKTPKLKAVMVWLHGGGFLTGTASDPTFDGSSLASRGDVVLVTVDYRLSTLGGLALSNSSLTGNYGLGDVVTALDWVRAHIGDFGGDKDRITVFGQSAGAALVRALLASPLARDKFARSIMMSNLQGMAYATPFSNYSTIAEQNGPAQALVAEVGCGQLQGEDTVQCLRKVDPWSLINAKNAAGFPVIDGKLLTSSLLLNPSAPKIKQPVMMGTMHDDGSPFTSYPTSSNLSAILSSQGYPASTILASNAFPLPDIANSTLAIFNLTSRVATDAQFRCLGQSTAYTGTANRIFDKVYTYEFDRSFQLRYWSPNPPACEAPITPDHPFGNPNLPYYKCHSGELTTVFGTVVSTGRPLRDDYDIPFSQFVLDSWSAFARTGDPNPDPAFLKARGFTNTTVMLEVQGIWDPVDVKNPMLKALDVGERGGMTGFREEAQCKALGFGLEYYNQ